MDCGGFAVWNELVLDTDAADSGAFADEEYAAAAKYIRGVAQQRRLDLLSEGCYFRLCAL